jgi:hypothetical protein
MSRLSLTDWYRYLESQFADDAPEPQSSESPMEASAQSPPTPTAACGAAPTCLARGRTATTTPNQRLPRR